MKVFLAGATGAIGSPLVRQLLDAGHDVSALTRSPERAERLAAAGVEPVVVDVFDRDSLVHEVGRVRPDAIVNELTALPARLDPRRLAAIYAPNNRVRREGTANLLAAARACGVGRLITQSAAYWYAPDGGDLRTEDDPLYTDAPDPIGSAVRTMHAVEERVLAEPEVTGVVLRYGSFYGPGTWFAREGDVGRRMRKRAYPIIGDGSGVSSFVHVEDVAGATVAALSAEAGVYNVVDDEPATARVWMPVYAQALGAPRPLRVPRWVAALFAGSAFVTWVASAPGADNRKAKAALGWTLRYPSWRSGFAEALG